MATILKLSSHRDRWAQERGTPASAPFGVPAQVIVFPGMSLAHLRLMAASMQASDRKEPVRPAP
jgi:hypothetical protein